MERIQTLLRLVKSRIYTKVCLKKAIRIHIIFENILLYERKDRGQTMKKSAPLPVKRIKLLICLIALPHKVILKEKMRVLIINAMFRTYYPPSSAQFGAGDMSTMDTFASLNKKEFNRNASPQIKIMQV